MYEADKVDSEAKSKVDGLASTQTDRFGFKVSVSHALLLSLSIGCIQPVKKPTFSNGGGSAYNEGDVIPEPEPSPGPVSGPLPRTTPTPGPSPVPVPTPKTPATPSPNPAPNPAPAPAPQPNDGTPAIGSVNNGWTLKWSDEFNGTELDESKWAYEIKPPRWVNEELQGYNKRKENVRLEGGHLVIEARKDNFSGQEYTSGRIKTQAKHSWKYGRIEASMKLPGGLGTWPAFWMMPEDQGRGWPACGEIDIMEEVGYDVDNAVATTHTKTYNWANNNVKTNLTKVDGITTGYHTYAAEWYPDRIDFFADGRKYHTVVNEGKGEDSWPFDKNFHIIFNLAVGGAWGGLKGVDGNIWPKAMLVDWVRVYQK